jgi:hypothetical protein
MLVVDFFLDAPSRRLINMGSLYRHGTSDSPDSKEEAIIAP